MHKTLPLIILFSTLVTGCANLERIEKEQNIARARYFSAEQKRHFTCLTKPECDKAFRIPKNYILEQASMNVQNSDDVFIATFRPIRIHMIGLKAARKPIEKETEQITLTAECPEFSYGSTGYCDTKMAIIYEDFIPYIEQYLK